MWFDHICVSGGLLISGEGWGWTAFMCRKEERGNGYEDTRGENLFFSINILFSFLSCSSFPFLCELSICPIDLFILWDIILFVMGQQGSSFLFPLPLLLSSSKVLFPSSFFKFLLIPP